MMNDCQSLKEWLASDYEQGPRHRKQMTGARHKESGESTTDGQHRVNISLLLFFYQIRKEAKQ